MIVPILLFALSLSALVSLVPSIRRCLGFRQKKQKPIEHEVQSAEPSEIDISQIVPIKDNFDWRKQKQIPYRPWNNGPYHVTMGLKTTNVENWIEIDETYLVKYQLKRKVYQEHWDEAVAVLPGCGEGAFEALELLKETLVRRYPTMFKLLEPHLIHNLVTGDVWDLSSDASTWEKHHPLEIMGLLATDDFFLLFNDAETGETTLRAAATCFPAGFKIEERIGQSLWGIHAGKVPQYESKLAKSMDRFFQRLKVGSVVSRFNYAIDDSDELFHRRSHHNLSLPEGDDPKLSDLHLRVERQVLQRLPKTRALLFTIRTYVTPITEVTKDREVAAALRTSVNSYTDDVAKYKNKNVWDKLLQKHLSEILDIDE